MNGSPFMLQAAAPVLVTTKRCTRVPAAPCIVELATLTPLVAHGGNAAAVVVVGGGAVVAVVEVVTTGLFLGVVAEQAASTSAAPRTTDAVLRENRGRGR